MIFAYRLVIIMISLSLVIDLGPDLICQVDSKWSAKRWNGQSNDCCYGATAVNEFSQV